MYDDASDVFGSTLTFLADHEYSDQVGYGRMVNLIMTNGFKQTGNRAILPPIQISR